MNTITATEAALELGRRALPKTDPARQAFPARHIMQASTPDLRTLAEAPAPKAPAKGNTRKDPAATARFVATETAKAVAQATAGEGEYMRTMIRTRTELLTAGNLRAVKAAAKQALKAAELV